VKERKKDEKKKKIIEYTGCNNWGKWPTEFRWNYTI